MKKIAAILLVLGFVLTGCSNPNKNNATWDCVEYETLDELNNAAGTNITAAQISEKTDEWFGLISDNIAQYTFKAGQEEWCVRASKDVDDDISGLHYDNIRFEKDIESIYYTDEVYMGRFFNNDVQYVVILDTKELDVSTRYFDEVFYEFMTNITGVRSGYENEVFEEGDDVISRTTLFNQNGTTTVLDSIYTFDGNTLVKITSRVTFDSEQAVNEYLSQMAEAGRDVSEFVLDGTSISADSSANLDFYSEYDRSGLINWLKSTID